MARIAYVQDITTDPTAKHALEQINERRGTVPLFLRGLVQSPAAALAFDAMSAHVNTSTLDASIRELAMLRTIQWVGNEFEWRRHVSRAVAAGITEAQVQALPDWTQSDELDDAQRAVLAVIDDLVDDWRVDESIITELGRHFTPGEIVEVLLVVGWQLMIASLILPLDFLSDDPPPSEETAPLFTVQHT
jgi:alkylhydroperoxidase family enzyme